MNQRDIAILGAVRRALLLTTLASPMPLFAQTRPQVELPPPSPEITNPAPQVSVDSSRVDETAGCPLADPKLASVTAKIDRIAYVGAPLAAGAAGADTQYAPVAPVLLELLTQHVIAPGGTAQPIAVVCGLRDTANAALRKAGYVASVQIPPQEIKDGTLRLMVIAAKLVEVRVVGDVGHFRSTVEKRSAALMALDPLNRFAAERILLLAGDIPGLKIQLALRPAGRGPGEVIGELKVDAQPFALLANIQNYGSRQLGREIASLRGEAYGLTGLDDRTYLSFSNSLQWRETHVIQGGHDMGLGERGFRIGARASYALSNPSIPNLDLRSKSLIAGLDLSMPVVRALNHNLRAAAGFEWLTQRTIFHQGNTDAPFTRDHIRVAYARLDGDARGYDGAGNIVWSLEGYAQIRKGVDVLGASKRFEAKGGFQPSRFDGDPQATVVSGEVRATVRPVPIFAIEGSVYGQWANHSLLNLEEFSIGNLTYGRGYDPGSNGADRVIAARAQPRLQVIRPNDRFKLPFGVEVLGFYDWVRLYNLDPGTLETKRSLASTGGGARLTLPNNLILDVLYAHPLYRALSTDLARPSDRVLVSLTLKLLPWGLF
ncbi:ShlB/FhaC/HecB family hemolysin secretion/activation protein [soil metagenome]